MALLMHPRAEYESDTIDIHLLSGFEVTSGAMSLDFPLVGSRLIAYLALQQRPVSRSMVAGVLWPETTQDKAQASLRSALWRVRKVCDMLVRSVHDCLTLTEDVTVDVDALLETSRQPDLEKPVPLDVPVSLFSCELLPDWCDDWVVFERERFRLAALHALDRIATSCMNSGDFGSAADYALMAIRLEPLRESSHRALVQTHLAQGNLCEAARQYHTYRRMLIRELGVEPTALMTTLIAEAGLCVDDGSDIETLEPLPDLFQDLLP